VAEYQLIRANREEAAMLSRVAFILCVIISVAACNKKSEPTATDTKPTPAQREADAITTAEGPVKVGGNYGTFRASNSTALKLAKGTTLTAFPEGPIVAFRINDGAGGSIRCQCDGGCTGACTWETSPTDANCSGTCEGPSVGGQTCGACSWHYEGPEKVSE
jgi:hypothetical protein